MRKRGNFLIFLCFGGSMRIPKGGIAFFDSGIGGLTVMATCQNYFKNEIFYYYGDNHHAPYGNLSLFKIKKYVRNAFKKFKRLNVKAVVIACNTVTAACIEDLRKEFSFPIIGAEPSVLKAVKMCYNKNVGNNEIKMKETMYSKPIYVLTTRTTYESERFHELCRKTRKRYPMCNLCLCACDELAGIIEKNILNEQFDYAPYLPKGETAAVVLGCTHYIYIKKKIEDFYHCFCFDGNDGIAKRLVYVLRETYKSYTKEDCNNKDDDNNEAASIEKSGRGDHKAKNISLYRLSATTFNPHTKKREKLRQNLIKKDKKNCSHVLQKNTESLLIKRGENDIFFLGKAKRWNAFIYKQMFGF